VVSDAYVDQLVREHEAELAALRADILEAADIVVQHKRDCDALRERVAELEADAARYQFIKANVRRLDINGLCLSIQNLEVRIDQMRGVPSAGVARPQRMDLKRFQKAPCYICGYNGPNYYQPEVHDCAGLYHEQADELP